MLRFLALLLTAALISPCALAQKVSDASELASRFVVAVQADSLADMKGLLEANRNPGLVANAFDQLGISHTARRLGGGDEEELKKSMLVLERLAQMDKLYGSRNNFLEKRLAWMGGLDEKANRLRLEMWNGMSEAIGSWNAAQRGDPEAVKKAVKAYTEASAVAKEAGDHYHAAMSAMTAGSLARKLPDWFMAAYHYKSAADLGRLGSHAADAITNLAPERGVQEAIKTGKIREEFLDTSLPLEEARAAYEKKVAEAPSVADTATAGIMNDELGKALGNPPNVFPAGTEMGWETTEGLKRKALKKEPTWDPPYYRAAGAPMSWGAFSVPKGGVVKFSLLPGDPEFENDGGKLMLYPKGQGASKAKRIKLKEKPSVVTFKNVEYLDKSVGDVHHWMVKMGSTFKLMGKGFRTSGQTLTVFYKGATYVTGEARGVPFEIHDIDGNGAFNDFGLDAIVTGTKKNQVVLPLSKYVNLGSLLYELKVEINGSAIRTKPYDGPLAAVKLDWKGKKRPTALLAKGDSREQGYFVDLTRAIDKPIWVVPCKLQFENGYIAEGKGKKRKTIFILRGRAPWIDIEAGKIETIPMGGAGEGYTIGFEPKVKREDGGKELVEIEGTALKFFGGGGEEYSRMEFGNFLPEVKVRKEGRDRVMIKGKMKVPDSGNLNATNIFFPGTIELKKTFKGPFEVQLEGESSALGKFTSEWTLGR